MRLPVYLLLLLFVQPSLYAQQRVIPQQVDTSYRLLWYKGKKIKPNVLLTRAYDTVYYTPSKGLVKVISKAGPGREYDKMLTELNRTPQRMSETMQKAASALPKQLVPYFAQPVKTGFEQVRGDYADALSNNIALPDLGSTVFSPEPSLTASQAALKKFLDDLKVDDIKDFPAIREVLEYYEQHKNEKITSIPAPPRNDFTYCNSCDSSFEKAFEREYELFKQELFGKDKYIMERILGILRQSEFVFLEDKRDEVRRLLLPVFDWLKERGEAKARLLVEKYADDPYRVRSVTMIILGIERQKQLLGKADETGYFMAAFDRCFQTMISFLKKAIAEYDYSVALNLQLILATERQFQLLKGKSAISVWDLMSFNQFKMSLDISAKITGNGGYVLAHVSGDNWFAAVPDENCKLKWVLLGPDKDRMHVELIAADIRGPGGQGIYRGTKDWLAAKPLMRLDFCDTPKDTLEIFTFQAKNSQELWEFPALGTKHLAKVNAVLTGCFIDEVRLREKAGYFSDPANVAKLKKQMEEQYQQFMKNGGANLNAGSTQAHAQDLQKMKEMALALNASNKITELIHAPNAGSYLVLPTVNNRSKLVFKEKLNGKEIFPRNAATEYAWLHVSLEQDPDSPYRDKLLNK